MNAVTAWSFSRWQQHEKCPLSYKLRVIDKIPEPPSEAMMKGNVFHQAAADYLTGKSDTRPKTKLGSQLDELRAFPGKIVEQQMAFTAQTLPTAWFAKNAWCRVVWDVGLLYDDDTGELIDHKTGKKYGHNRDQNELFAVSMYWKFPKLRHVTTRLWYHDSGEEEIDEFPASIIGDLDFKWRARGYALIGATTFPPRPGDHCRRCAFSKSNHGSDELCRFG